MGNDTNSTLLQIQRVVDEFLLSRRANQCSKRTLEYYTAELNNLLAFLADCGIDNIADITASHLREFMVLLSQRRSAGGLHCAYRVIKTLLRWVEFEYEPEDWQNPIAKIKPPKLNSEPLKPVEFAVLKKMLDTCERNFTGVRDRAIMLMLLDTGLRAIEMIRLHLADIDGTAIAVHSGKGGKSRVTFIGDTTRQALNRYLRYRGLSTGPLWVSESREPLNMNGLKSVIRRRANAANVPMPGLHSFRRAFAVALLKDGANLRSIQHLLGHSDISTTQRYLRLELEDLQAAHERHGPVNGFFKRRRQ